MAVKTEIKDRPLTEDETQTLNELARCGGSFPVRIFLGTVRRVDKLREEGKFTASQEAAAIIAVAESIAWELKTGVF